MNRFKKKIIAVTAAKQAVGSLSGDPEQTSCQLADVVAAGQLVSDRDCVGRAQSNIIGDRLVRHFPG